LLRKVQIDELRGDETYPHEFVTRQLMKILAQQGFESEFLDQTRVLFCEPFDSFIVDEKKDPKRRGAILQHSVTIIWDWLITELFHDSLPDLEIEIIQAFRDARPEQARKLIGKFHQQAGDRIWSELSTIEEGSKTYLAYTVKFGKSGVFEDALEMARILRIAPALIQLRNHIQAGLTLQQDEDVLHCHSLYKQFLKSTDDHIELGMMLISNRLAKPCEILKLLRHHTGTELDTIILRDPACLSATRVLIDLEGSITEAISLIGQYENFPLVEKKITEFYQCMGLFTSLVEITPGSLWGSRIIQIRNNLSSAIKQQIEQLPRLINTLRYKNKTHSSSSRQIGEKSGPNTYDIRQTIYIANLLRVSGRQLKQLSINDAFTKAKNEANNFIEVVAEIAVSKLAKADTREKNIILKYFKPIVELTSILQGEELASLLERRGESAYRAKPVEDSILS